MHAESVVEPRELSPSFDHRWTEHRPAAPASISPTATASQSRLPVQVPMSGAGTLSHYPPAHYNPHPPSSYSDRPFASSSPTDSSPSGSPFHPDHHTLARISTTTRPLFLAQHTTPLTPTNLESLSLASPVVAAPPPPPHALVVDKVAAHPPPPPPMAYVSPHHAHYSFPGIYNPPEHRHQLPVGGYTYQVHYPHAYEYPTDNYRMNPGQNSGVVDDSSSYETPPLVLGHFTPTSQVPSGGGGVWSPVESPHYGPGAPGQVGHHSHRPPIQTQLLLANAMPITTDIVSPTRGSMEGSVSVSTSFAPEMSREYSNPPTPATAHGSGGYTGGTQMGICNGQAAPIAATQPSNAGEGSMIPAQNQASPFEPAGIPVTMSTGAPVVGAETEQQVVKTEQATHEGEVDRQQYVQVEQNQTLQQQMDGGLSRSFAPDPDGPEVPRSTNHARELILNDKVDNASRDDCQSAQDEASSVGQKNEMHEINAQMGGSQHAHEPTNANGGVDMESRYADVAVAQITALVARDDSGRYDRIHVSSRDERANVDGRGAGNSVLPTEDTFNGQASTLKALATNQSGSHHQTTTDLHDPSSFGDDTRHTLKDAGVVPIAHVHPIHQTGISHHVDIDHSYSIPLQTPVTPHQDMQAISSAPFHHQFHQHHAPHVSGYSYEPASSFIPSSTFNHHSMHPPRPEWRRGSYPEYATTSGHSQSNRGSPLLLPQDDLRMQRSVSPVPTQNMVHRHSLPTSSLSHNLGSMSARASPHSSPSLQGAAPTGYYNTSARLVPAAFNGSPRNGSGSSGSSTPPTVPQEPSSSMGLYQQVVPGPQAPAHFHVTTPSTFDSSLDQRPPYEPAFSAFHGPSSAPQQAYGMRASDPVYYSPAQYPGEVVYSSTSGGPRHFDPLARGSSTSPAPPMIAGLKRTREDEWADASEREAQRRRLSYTQSGPAMHHSVHFTYPSSPSLATPEMGVIRVGSSQGHGHGPTLKEMGIRDAVSESLHGGSHMHMKRPDGYSREGPETSYSFISLPGNTIRKRPRRKFEEITRNYVCSWPDCTKAYGTLNHLNAHVTMQKHGAKRTPAEFKELRKAWRKQKREQQQQGHSHANGATAGRRGSSELPGDDDGGDDDDTGSLYGP